MGKLDGKVALVTGAGRQRGIGRATALRLAEEGADVAVSALPRAIADLPAHEQDERMARRRIGREAEIEAIGRRAIAIDCDVTRPDQVISAIETIVRRFGQARRGGQQCRACRARPDRRRSSISTTRSGIIPST